ncbi:PR domain zinc finger protein 10 isoform X1 [Bufo bufo]|uniref:PR domain zinc finger protein 10 isoform X1 n=1 Tax=Bufo bufo TaxID=8384 RepID=UPI001ABECF00|nr:PR domain zinc finger protein 10 isoform X1 [Bufo bufo]XP_040287945.1 PR domain zinc finger protein 10 isoform X1 [Bufo bufo]
MDSKQESPDVWPPAEDETSNTTQVHFVRDGGAVAQIVYSDDQDRPPQQVVYTADGSSFTSVEASEHTLVYIHPVDGSQTLFTDQPQVAYVQQDATTQQVTVLLPPSRTMNAANLALLSSVPESAQTMSLEPVPQPSLSVHDSSLPPVDGTADMTTLQNSSAHSQAKDDDDEEDEDDDDEDDDDEEEDDEEEDSDEWEPDPPRPFDPNDLWCEECNNAHPSVCPKHGALHPIPNRPVLTRARASLPLVLYIDRFLGGVYSKRRIPKRTQFGPLEGPLVKKSELKDTYIHLKVLLNSLETQEPYQEDLWFDLSEESLCNWMMFVRPAQNHLEQNLVAYQYGQHIYYTTIKNIEPKQELRVWYAASYAEFVNQKIHDISQEERKVLREQEKNWPCYECNRRFMSSEQLQQHLNSHDEKLDFFSRAKGRGRGKTRRKFGPGRRPGRPPKFMRLEMTGEKCSLGSQDLLHFQNKQPQFEDSSPSTMNGLDLSGLSLVPATQSTVDPQAESQLLQPHSSVQSIETTLESTLTAEDMRRAKRIRNAALQHLFIRKTYRPFKCLQCGKAFREKEKLDQHLRFHGRDGNCPLTCDICNKGFISTSSLENHMKFHLDQKTYSCIFCTDSFDRLDLLKDHVAVHIVNGSFSCPTCKKRFSDFIQVKKHVRSFHSEKIYQCTECDKAFCRPDKLRLHMLRHSDRKDFLCSTCGKQFKRKDKLREHMQRMHNPEREAKKADRTGRTKAFKPRIASTDYESFMFKCRVCMMGFRRRGMLVNHLSKRHPEMKIEEVPELTLPIIKPNRDYYCQYCEKVYKSASKRKAHILKNHPGAELPPSIRKLRPAGPGEPDPMLSTHTQLTGTIATPPVCCPHCAKQYSSKTKMVQHIRKKHPEFALLPVSTQTTMINAAPTVLTADGASGETVVTTDLLTQAMTELSQTLTTEYRTAQGDYQRIQYIPVSQATAGMQQPQHIQLQVVQVAQAPSPHQTQHSTVDMGQLHESQGYSQHAIQVQHIQVTEPSPGTQASSQVGAQTLSPSSQEAEQEVSPSDMQTPTSQTQTNSTVQHAYLQSGWNSFRGYPSEIQMMTLPQGQYVITEAAVGTSVTPVNSGQVKTHYVISDGQTDLDMKKAAALTEEVVTNQDHMEQTSANPSQTTQYIITTTTNMNGSSEMHIGKP